jgi:excisionase family DNA binding protein
MSVRRLLTRSVGRDQERKHGKGHGYMGDLRYLSTSEAADIIGVSTTTMRSYVSGGEIPFTDVGRNGRPRIRISEDDLRRFMEARKTKTPAGAA